MIRIALLGLSLCVTGCATMRPSHEPGLVTQWDRQQPLPAMEPPPELSLVLHTRYLTFDQPSGPSMSKWWSKRRVRQQCEAVMGEFPFLGAARWDADGTSFRLVIEATHAIRGSTFRSGLSSLTKYIIPVSERGVMELEAWLDRDAQLLQTYEAVGSYPIQRHLLFLLTPWMWGVRVPGRAMEKTAIQDTFRDLFLQMQHDAATLFTP